MTFEPRTAAHDLLGSEVRFAVIGWVLEQRRKGITSFAYKDISGDLHELSDVHRFLKQLVQYEMLERRKPGRGWPVYSVTTSPLWGAWAAMAQAFALLSQPAGGATKRQAAGPNLRVIGAELDASPSA